MTKTHRNTFNAVPTAEPLDDHYNRATIPVAEAVNDAHSATDNSNNGEEEQAGMMEGNTTIFPLEKGSTDSLIDGYCNAGTRSNNSSMIMVEVVAPANLHEGYKFDAFFNGVKFPIIVPAGGCTKNQVLIVPFNPNASSGTPNAWKDGILACTRYGLLHPSLLCAWCCPLILLGQVMTRLKMDWTGHISKNPDEWKKTFRTLLILGIFKFVVFQDVENPLHTFLTIYYVIYLTYLLVRVRKHIRDRDGISQGQCCGQFEDCFMAWCLPCCTVSQLARQTANYDIEVGYFVTQDGLVANTDDVDLSLEESMII